ncbi:MAG: PHP domain-containing protein [Spirochaetales bacterium]
MNELEQLNSEGREQRLRVLARMMNEHENLVEFTDEVNNHVHTFYSFSPYSPTAAAWMARAAGLRAVGSVDHDSISAAEEMIAACKIVGIASTVGCEVRVNFTGTRVEGRKINNPDSPNLAYMVMHGIPRNRIPEVDAFLHPIREERNKRNKVETAAMSHLLVDRGGPQISFDQVLSHSRINDGGGVTERHILYAASLALIKEFKKGKKLRKWLEEKVTGTLPEKLQGFLDDTKNPHYAYDLLGAMKGSFLTEFFVQPSERECVHVSTAVDFANSINAIPAYAYLGDVGESPTGDKKAEEFEDSYLDELFEELSALDYKAVTYMPPRNTLEQLKRVQSLCEKHELMEISGVDINSSRQSFHCEEILQPEFRHLITSTWALIAHEKLTSADPQYALFVEGNPSGASLKERVDAYAEVGRRIDPRAPERAAELIPK